MGTPSLIMGTHLGTNLSGFVPICAEHASSHRNKKAAITQAINRLCGSARNAQEGLLLSDAEAAEDFAEQVVGGEFAGDGVEGFLGKAEFFGEEFGAGNFGGGAGQVFAG